MLLERLFMMNYHRSKCGQKFFPLTPSEEPSLRPTGRRMKAVHPLELHPPAAMITVHLSVRLSWNPLLHLSPERSVHLPPTHFPNAFLFVLSCVHVFFLSLFLSAGPRSQTETCPRGGISTGSVPPRPRRVRSAQGAKATLLNFEALISFPVANSSHLVPPTRVKTNAGN